MEHFTVFCLPGIHLFGCEAGCELQAQALERRARPGYSRAQPMSAAAYVFLACASFVGSPHHHLVGRLGTPLLRQPVAAVRWHRIEPPQAATPAADWTRRRAQRTPAASLVYKAEEPTPMVELYANGQVNQYSSTLVAMRGRYKLSGRDKRLLRSSTRVLAPREGYILFDFGDLKGVLQHDRVTLVGADRPAVTALAAEVKQRLVLDDTADPTQREEAPFEVRVIECMLEQTYALLEESLQRLSALVTSTLAELTDPSQQSEARREAALGRLLPLQISLNSLGARTERLASVLEEVLDNEEDLKDFALTRRHNQLLQDEWERLEQNPPTEAPDGGRGDDALEFVRELSAAAAAAAEAEAAAAAAATGAAGAARAATSAEAEVEEAEEEEELVETLIEVYNSRLDSLNDRIEELATNIETTQGTLELQLDNERNRIARLELTLNMAGLCVGVSAMVSGFFGMNLASGVETVPFGFVVATACSLLLSFGMFAACTRRYRVLSSQQRSRLQDVQALKSVLANVDGVALLLRNRPATDLRRLLTGSGVPPMNERELTLLQGILEEAKELPEPALSPAHA